MTKSGKPKPIGMEVSRGSVLRPTPGLTIAKKGFAGGRLVPIALVDTADHPEIDELIRVHEFFAEGDVNSYWGTAGRDSARVLLHLDFVRPLAAELTLDFRLPEDGTIVDLAVQSCAIYLQAKPGPEEKESALNRPKILVSLPSGGFEEKWHRMYRKSVTKQLRVSGLGWLEAPSVADEHICGWQGMMRNTILPLDEGPR